MLQPKTLRFVVFSCLALGAVPARAAVRGGIEIGAKGVKAAVIDVTAGADGYEVDVKATRTINTTLVRDLARTGRFDADALKETTQAVKKLHDLIRTEHKVPADRIHIVGSSGLFSALPMKDDRIKRNRDDLTEAIRKATGVKMDFIDARQEAELTIQGVVPPKLAAESYLVDVGSGNTKGGAGGDGKFDTFSVPFGTVTFSDHVRQAAAKSGQDFAKQAAASRNQTLVPELKKSLEGKDLAKRKRVYLTGGIAWATATLTRPGDRGGLVVLTVKDIDALEAHLLAKPKEFPAPDLSEIADEAKRKVAAAEVASVKKVFTPEQLLGGLQVLKALAGQMDWAEKDRRLLFARHGQVAWIVSYVARQGAK